MGNSCCLPEQEMEEKSLLDAPALAPKSWPRTLVLHVAHFQRELLQHAALSCLVVIHTHWLLKHQLSTFSLSDHLLINKWGHEICLVSGYLTGISACSLSLLYQRLPDPKGTCGRKTRVPQPHGHKERRRRRRGKGSPLLLPIHGVVGMLQEVRGLFINQAIGVTRDAGGAGCPHRGHGCNPRQKRAPATPNRLGAALLTPTKLGLCTEPRKPRGAAAPPQVLPCPRTGRCSHHRLPKPREPFSAPAPGGPDGAHSTPIPPGPCKPFLLAGGSEKPVPQFGTCHPRGIKGIPRLPPPAHSGGTLSSCECRSSICGT